MAKQQQKMLAGAGVLALAGLIAKVLSAIYRVPFQNIVGNQGFYVYQQVYPIYGIGMVMALSGWPLFISKLVAEQDSQLAKQLIAKRLFWLLMGLSVLLFTGLFFGAPVLAKWMHDGQLTAEIKAVAWMFLLMPFLAVGRGYTQGQLNMVPTAFSQVIEQVVRVSLILVIAWYGMQHAWSIYTIGTWSTFVATLAGLAAVAYLFRRFKEIFQRKYNPQKVVTIDWLVLLKRFWTEGGLLALLAALLVLLQLVDSFTVKGLLQVHGLSGSSAETMKGIYDRGQPLVQLGMVVATGLGTALLPNLHEQWQNKNWAQLQQTFKMTMRLSIVFAVLTTAGLIVVMPVVNQFLFSNRQGDVTLMWYAVIVIPATLITVVTSVLQSLDRTKGLFWFIVLTLLIKCALNHSLIPIFGIMGAALATLVALIPLLLFVLWRIPKKMWSHMSTAKWWLDLCLTTVVVAATAGLIRVTGDQLLGTTRLSSVLTTVLSVGCGSIIGLWLVVKLHLFTSAELLALPKGERIVAKLEEKNRCD